MNIIKKLLILAVILFAASFAARWVITPLLVNSAIDDFHHQPSRVTPRVPSDRHMPDDRDKALAEYGRAQDLMAWTEAPPAVALSSTADSDWLAGLKNGASDLWDAAKEKSSEIVDTVKEKGPGWLESAKDKAGDLVEAGKEKLPEVVDKAKDGLHTAQDKVSQFREDQENQFWQWEDQMLNGETGNSNQSANATPSAAPSNAPANDAGSASSSDAAAASSNPATQAPIANPDPNTANPQGAASAQNPVANSNSGDAAAQDAAPVESAPLRSGIYTIDGKLYRYDAETNEWSEANPLPVEPDAEELEPKMPAEATRRLVLITGLIVALICTLIAVPLLVLASKKTRHSKDQ